MESSKKDKSKRCEICEKLFPSYSNKYQHDIVFVHGRLSERNHKCNLCKKFYSKRNAKQTYKENSWWKKTLLYV